MKKTARYGTIGFLSFFAALVCASVAAATAGFGVSQTELAAGTGLANVSAVAPDGTRFRPPVQYFRSPETISAADARRDCADCGNLIAVYIADAPAVPAWAAVLGQRSVKIGGRFQLRTYLAARKRIVIVTAPSETTVRKISAFLVGRFSK